MMRQVTTTDFCMNSRPSCLAEDGHHPAAHFELCTSQSNKFYPPPPPTSLQMTLAPMVLPTQSHKSMVCHRQDILGGDQRSPGKIPGLKGSEQTPSDAKKRPKVPGRQADAAGLWEPLSWLATEPAPGDPSAPPEPQGSRQAREGRSVRPEPQDIRSAPDGLLAASKACPASTNWLTVAPAAEQLSPTRYHTKKSSVNPPAKRRLLMRNGSALFLLHPELRETRKTAASC